MINSLLRTLISLLALYLVFFVFSSTVLADISAYDLDSDTYCDGNSDAICCFNDENASCEDDDRSDGYCFSPEQWIYDDLNYEVIECFGDFGRIRGDEDLLDCETTGCYTLNALENANNTVESSVVRPFKVYPDILGEFDERCILVFFASTGASSGETITDYNIFLDSVDLNSLVPGDCNYGGTILGEDYGSGIGDENVMVACGCAGIGGVPADLNSNGWTPDKDAAGPYVLSASAVISDGNTYSWSFPIPKGEDYAIAYGDCDDSNSSIGIGSTEVCDGIDNDCDGKIDEELVACYERRYEVRNLGGFVIKEPITFDASDTSCVSGCDRFQWDFEYDTGFDIDGNSDYNTTSNTYYTVGDYTIYLVATDSVGAEDHVFFNLTAEQDPFVTVLYPNGGEKLSGSTFISYRIADPDSNTVQLDFFYDTDTTPTGRAPIADATIDVNGEFSGIYYWSLAEVPYGYYYVCIVGVADGNTNEDCSDNRFYVGPRSEERNLPDLVLEELTLARARIEEGEQAVVKARVRNAGEAVAGQFVVSMFKDVLLGDLLDSSSIGSLDLNQAVDLAFSFTPRRAGTYFLYVMADSTQQVQEMDENNNHAFVSLNVVPVEEEERKKKEKPEEKLPELVPGRVVLFYEKLLYVGDVQKVLVYYDDKPLPDVLVRIVFPDGTIREYGTDLVGEARFIVDQEGEYVVIVGSIMERFTVKKKGFFTMLREILASPVIGYSLLIALIIAVALFLAAMYYLKMEKEEKEWKRIKVKKRKK